MLLLANDPSVFNTYIISAVARTISSAIHYVYVYSLDERFRDILLENLLRIFPHGVYGINSRLRRNAFELNNLIIAPILYEEISCADKCTLIVLTKDMSNEFIKNKILERTR